MLSHGGRPFRRSRLLGIRSARAMLAEDATSGEMATEDNPGRVPSRIVFTDLICAAYVYVAFWVGFMIEGAFGHNG
jgi:hypothetical protein